MRVPKPLKTELTDLGDDFERSDLWLFGPLIAVIVAMPLAIIAITSVSLWYAASHADLQIAQRAPTTFANRWVQPPETVLR